MKKIVICVVIALMVGKVYAQCASPLTYLSTLRQEMCKKWPENRTLNIVFHGHSVPTGYFATPHINTLAAYPHQTLCILKSHYPNAAINVITTGIGGEQAEQGAHRFEKEVLRHAPDLLFIDYALNDRGIGLERAKKAWVEMIESALDAKVKVILLTPTPDLTEDILKDDTPLQSHAEQIRALAAHYQIGLVDCYAAFRKLAMSGENISDYMSQSNHPNEKGHTFVASLIAPYYLP